MSLLLLSTTSAAFAQTGVSDDRVSLPDGPGSLDGIGDNASVDANMGQMSTSVKIRVPGGYAGVTPELALAYSSGGGGGMLGTGWSMSLPFIERMTSKGLPDYDDDDRFVFGGSEQLVRIDEQSDTDVAVYRARFEGAFVRYKWHDRGNGDEGHWTAESPDGTVTTFGADFDGTPNESTRVRSPDGIFRYLAKETQDAWGHRMTYSYQTLGGKPYIETIAYVIDDEGTAGQRVVFTYEERDDKISDARGGFNEVTGHRLTDVEVFTGNTRIRHYELTYEPYANAGGASRLSRVRTFGANGSLYPIQYTFTYSKSLAGVCDGVECEAPFVVDVGSLDGVNLQAGNATLVDMNGDGLPDFIETPTDGSNHQIYISELDEDGTHSFSNPQPSALNDTSSTQLTIPGVQMLDHDGDGFADLVNALTGQIFVNDASGDWAGTINVGASGSLAASDFDFDEDADELTTLRFFDYNSDGMIDILKAAGTGTAIVENTGAGFANVPTVEDIGATFVDNNLELADMNGDGLLDPTIIAAGEVRYRINLGHGKWADWKTVPATQITVDNLDFTSLEDLNGDGIDDVVTVIADTLTFALNRNGDHFDTVQTLTTVGGSPIPYRDADTTVLFADMNANGSNDVVWVTSTGGVQYLEMFPVRPNLLTRYENGIGLVTEVTYKSAVQERAKNPQGWPDPIPTPMLVVSTIDTYAAAGDPEFELHDLTTYSYARGFYDGVEKQFRGFGDVEIAKEGDDFQEASRAHQKYHLGQGALPERAGQLLAKEVFNEDGDPLLEVHYEYEACDIGGLDETMTSPQLKWQCQTATEQVEQEGMPAEEWVTTRMERSYDGYGNVIEERNLGVISRGGGGCGACTHDSFGEPCGAMCTGDERYEETIYVSPESNNDLWQLDLVQEEARGAEPDGRRAIRRYFYDGEAFEGLPAGQATHGFTTRLEELVDDNGTYAPIERNRSDAHGNVVEFIGANGDVASGKHRTFTSFSDDGLNITHQETMVTDDEGEYRLQRDLTYDPLFGKMASATRWSVVGGPAGLLQRWGYDEHGRRIWLASGEDTPASPTEAYAFNLAYPVSSVTTLKRTEVGGAFDIEEVTCIDGRGREIQTRTKVADGRYFISGLSLLNHRGKTVRQYESFEADSATCSRDVPDGTRYTEHFYDAKGREVRTTYPDADERGGVASVKRIEYGPLYERIFNEDDNDEDAVGYNTPNLVVRDGLDRMVRTERVDAVGADPIRYHVTYDDLLNIKGFIDPEGNEKVQTYDMRGRVVDIDDPDAGNITFEYDAMGNIVRETNGAGRVLRRTWDEQGRMVREWDEDDESNTTRMQFYDRHPDCPASLCQNLGANLAGTRFASPTYGTVDERLSYNNHAAVVRAERIINGASFVIESIYDNADRMTGERFPGGLSVDYTLDDMGRITAIPGVIDNVTFEQRGQVATMTMANGHVTSYAYDARNQMTGMEVIDGRDASILHHTYTTDRTGTLLGIDDQTPGLDDKRRNRVFTYDALHQMTGVVLDEGTEHEETLTLTYDGMERLTSKTSTLQDSAAHIGAYAYDGAGPKAVSQTGDMEWTYDAGGFATGRGAQAFSWSAWGVVDAITDEQGTTHYERNATNDRFARSSDSSRSLWFSKRMVVHDGIARLSVGVDDDPVAYIESDAMATLLLDDVDDDGAITSHDAFVNRDEDIARTTLRSAARAMLLDDDGTLTQFVHQDVQGSLLAVVDANGEVAERFDYHPFGGIRHSSAKQSEMARFAGIDYEPNGLLDFGKRFYAPNEGRFLSVDPAFWVLNGDAMNTFVAATASYAYASNNPGTHVDFGGTMEWTKGKKIALGVGIGVAAVAAGAVLALTPVGPALLGAAVAVATAATVVNFVGAAIGGVVGAVHSAVTQYHQLKNDYTKSGQKIPTKEKVKAAGWVAYAAVTGAVSGFFSGGISAGFQIADGGVKVAESKGKISHKTANRLMAGIAIGQAVTTVVNPLGLATSSADVGTRALSAAGGLAITGASEAFFNGDRARVNKKSRARFFKKKLLKLKSKLKKVKGVRNVFKAKKKKD